MRANEIPIYRATFNRVKLTGGLSVQTVIEFNVRDVKPDDKNEECYKHAWNLLLHHLGDGYVSGQWRLFHFIGCIGSKFGRDHGTPNTGCTCKRFPEFCRQHGFMTIEAMEESLENFREEWKD